MCKILDWKGGGTSSRDSVMCFQDCMTWLTTVTQLGSVICKSFRPVDLTIGRAGFFWSEWIFVKCIWIQMVLDQLYRVINSQRNTYINIYIHIFFSDIKWLFILTPEHLKKEVCLAMGYNCVIIQISDRELDLPYFSHQTKFIKFSEISSSLFELASR